MVAQYAKKGWKQKATKMQREKETDESKGDTDEEDEEARVSLATLVSSLPFQLFLRLPAAGAPVFPVLAPSDTLDTRVKCTNPLRPPLTVCHKYTRRILSPQNEVIDPPAKSRLERNISNYFVRICVDYHRNDRRYSRLMSSCYSELLYALIIFYYIGDKKHSRVILFIVSLTCCFIKAKWKLNYVIFSNGFEW